MKIYGSKWNIAFILFLPCVTSWKMFFSRKIFRESRRRRRWRIIEWMLCCFAESEARDTEEIRRKSDEQGAGDFEAINKNIPLWTVSYPIYFTIIYLWRFTAAWRIVLIHSLALCFGIAHRFAVWCGPLNPSALRQGYSELAFFHFQKSAVKYVSGLNYWM